MSNLQGTIVPSNAFVEKVYINVDLSIEEVVSIIDSANLTYNFSSKYTVVDGIEISNMLGKTIIVNNEIVFREADSMNTGVFVGWKEGFNGIVVVNKQNSYGTQNDVLSSLFSITPFTPAQDGQVIVSKSKLTAIADNIRNQTGATGLITLDEMAKMKLGGTDTSDATATSEDILLGKTAYVNDVKVVGTIEEYDGTFEGEAKAITGFADGTITEYSGQDTRVRGSVFYYCTSLISVNLPNATSVESNAFQYCFKLISVNLPNATSIGNSAFNQCGKLTSINLPNVTKIINGAFSLCQALTSIYIPKVTKISNEVFVRNYSLKAVIICQETSVCTLSNTNAFTDCYHLTGTVDTTYNPTGAKDGYIYVPDSKVNDYRQATNWSTYADQIKPLSELPQEYKDLYNIN